MTKPVLVATDLSEAGDEALRVGHRRAEAAGAELVVLHVIAHDPDIHPLFPQQLQDDVVDLVALEQRAADAVSARVEAITGRDSEHVRVDVDFGDPYATIVLGAEEVGAGIVILGAHGVTALELGHVAERVVRHAHCPVLVVRPARGDGAVVVGCDFSESATKAVAVAAREAQARSLRLVLVHDLDLGAGVITSLGLLGDVPLALPPETVTLVREAAERTLTGLLQSSGAPGECRVTAEGNPAAAIVRTADDVGADLVVVGARGRTGLGRLALGSVAESVVRQASCSVLTVRCG